MTQASRKYIIAFIGAFIGELIPFFFAYLDLDQMGLPYSKENFFEVFNSQNIYLISIFSFPFMFGLIFYSLYSLVTKADELEQKREFIKGVLDSIEDIIMVFDKNLNLIQSNKGFDRFYLKFFAPFYSREQLLGMIRVESLFHNRESSSVDELAIKDFDGRSHQFAVHANKCLVGSQELNIVSMKDIKDIVNKQQIIEEQRTQIEKSSRLSALGEMAGGIAHEINNPLAIINGNASKLKRNLVKGNYEDAKAFHAIETILGTIKRINAITRVLLSLTRSGSESEISNATAKEVLEDLIQLSSAKFRDAGVNFLIEYNGEGEVEFPVNKIQLSQILINLLNNAIDAVEGSPESWVEITLKKDKTHFYFVVTDSGNGIEDSVLEKMFEPMFTTKDVGKGTGLGLSLSYNMALSMGGELYYDSKSKNTCFTLKLPLLIDGNLESEDIQKKIA